MQSTEMDATSTTRFAASAFGIAPNNETLKPWQNPQSPKNCTAEATAAMNTQPDVKSGFQDILDAFWGHR